MTTIRKYTRFLFSQSQNSKSQIKRIKISFKSGYKFLSNSGVTIRRISGSIWIIPKKLKNKLQSKNIKCFKKLIELDDGTQNTTLKYSESVPFIFVVPTILLKIPRIFAYIILFYDWYYIHKKILLLEDSDLQKTQFNFYNLILNNHNYIVRKHLLSVSILVLMTIDIISFLSLNYREQFTLSPKWCILLIRLLPSFCYVLSKMLEQKKIKNFLGILFAVWLISGWPLSAGNILNQPVEPMPYNVYIERPRAIDSKAWNSKTSENKILEKVRKREKINHLNQAEQKNILKNLPQEKEILEEWTRTTSPKYPNKMK